MFNCPYNKEFWDSYSENTSDCLTQLDSLSFEDIMTTSKSPSIDLFKWASKKLDMTIIGGSIPYKENKLLYNRCLIFRKGEQLGFYDKLHLFDIDIPGKITYKESETLNAGDNLFLFDHQDFKIGIGICYDVRFPTLSMKLRELGCNLLIFPAVFNFTTGPMHFELLARARATDNQCYVCMCSNATNKEEQIFQCWGHTMVIDPYAKKLGDLGHDQGILTMELDPELVKEVRQAIPTSKQVRSDIINKF
jgi:omega-amidase